MKNYFETKEEAIRYKDKHQLCVRVPEYIECMKKWALVFPLKTVQQKEESKKGKRITLEDCRIARDAWLD